MPASRPPLFGHTVQETEAWLKELQGSPNLSRERQAYTALCAVLHTLRDRLTVEESAHLAAQLPTLLRGVFYEAWRPTPAPDPPLHRDAFYDAVRARLSDHPEIQPDDAVRAVFSLLAKRLGQGEMDDIAASLPKDLKAFFTRSG